MSVIIVPKIIRDKFGEECADAFTGLIKEIDLDARKDAIAIAAERFENRLTEEIGKVNQKITELEGGFDKKLSEEIGKVSQKIVELEGRIDKKLAEEIGKVNQRITEEIGKVNQRITEESGKLRLEMEKLRTEIEKNRADIIKWMFIFWVGQIGVLSAIIIVMMRLLK